MSKTKLRWPDVLFLTRGGVGYGNGYGRAKKQWMGYSQWNGNDLLYLQTKHSVHTNAYYPCSFNLFMWSYMVIGRWVNVRFV